MKVLIYQIVTKTGEKILCAMDDAERNALRDVRGNRFFNIQSLIQDDSIYDRDIIISLNQTSIESIRIHAHVESSLISL